MNVLIFGRGEIARREYEPNLLELGSDADASAKPHLLWVDKGKQGCFEVAGWENEPAIVPGEIDKILILSPPEAHYENLLSIADRYASLGLAFPEIYVEKPVYLESELGRWTDLLAHHPGLEDRAFYIDHYRFKDAIVWFLEHKSEILGSLGKIQEMGFVSLEKKGFWDSPAFKQGYLLEHGCHFVSMLDRVFPGIEAREWAPRRTRDWRAWVQADRPESCKRDSACLAFLTLAGQGSPEVAADAALTIIVGKGMADIKVLYLRGAIGSAQVWFNRGEIIVTSEGQQPTYEKVSAGHSYRAVAESILSTSKKPGLLLPLRQGIAEQEIVIAIRGHLPERATAYAVGEIPGEIARELARMSLRSG